MMAEGGKRSDAAQPSSDAFDLGDFIRRCHASGEIEDPLML
jgi:hypothetical protein